MRKRNIKTLLAYSFIVFTALVFYIYNDSLLWSSFVLFDFFCFLILVNKSLIFSISFFFLAIADAIYGLTTVHNDISVSFTNLSEISYSLWAFLTLIYLFLQFGHLLKNKTTQIVLLILSLIFIYLNFRYVLEPFFNRTSPKPEVFNLVNSSIYAIMISVVTSFFLIVGLLAVNLSVFTVSSGFILMFFSEFAVRYRIVLDPEGGANLSDYGWFLGLVIVSFGVFDFDKKIMNNFFADWVSARALLTLTVNFTILIIFLIVFSLGLAKVSNANDVSVFLVLIAFSWISSNFISLNVSRSFSAIVHYLKKSVVVENGVSYPNAVSKIDEVNSILQEYVRVIAINHQLSSEASEREKMESLSSLAAQVSHDIRSPLAALEMISGSLHELPEEKRLITRNSINRIRDIANTLLEYKKKNFGSETKAGIEIAPRATFQNRENVLIAPLIESIITEKRMQYRNLFAINIDFIQDPNSYGVFANVEVIEFQRMISNLINNAVEALKNQKGLVEVRLSSPNEFLFEISILDDGIGMTDEVLSKFGLHGETYGKINGNGLGAYHAMSTIQQHQGKIDINTSLNAGTKVTISLRRSVQESWFVPELRLGEFKKIVVFDDDQAIHNVWDERFEPFVKSNDLVVIHFSDQNDLKNYFRKNFEELSDALFLMDYEMLGTTETGLDIIDNFGIGTQSILVTSRYEDSMIRERCQSLRVKLIPKNMTAFVPIFST